jgi:hypothetical protein
VLESVRCHNSLRFDRWQRPGDARNSFFLDATVLSHSDVEELELINSKRHSFCTTPPLTNVFFIDVEELERIKKKIASASAVELRALSFNKEHINKRRRSTKAVARVARAIIQ